MNSRVNEACLGWLRCWCCPRGRGAVESLARDISVAREHPLEPRLRGEQILKQIPENRLPRRIFWSSRVCTPPPPGRMCATKHGSRSLSGESHAPPGRATPGRTLRPDRARPPRSKPRRRLTYTFDLHCAHRQVVQRGRRAIPEVVAAADAAVACSRVAGRPNPSYATKTSYGHLELLLGLHLRPDGLADLPASAHAAWK